MRAKTNVVLFWAIQATALLAFVYPPTGAPVVLAVVSHYARMIGVTLCFHRHMAHRAFALSRPVRFFFAWLGTAALQKGPLWWAGNHVYHHNSRNSFWTTLVTLGEGWHNNHHRFPRAARNGFFWWEVDPTYWTVKVLAFLGLATDVVPVPARVYGEAKRGTEGLAA